MSKKNDCDKNGHNWVEWPTISGRKGTTCTKCHAWRGKSK